MNEGETAKSVLNLRPDVTAVDLFAGAGGLGLGLESAGIQVRAAVEVDEWAAETYRSNLAHDRVLVADISTMSDPDLAALAPGGVDVVAGGPPCQGFSHSNIRNRDPRDPRNSLFREFLRAVDVLRPRACLLENVPGLLNTRDAAGRSAIDTILRSFREVGYEADFRLVNAADFGVPQVRERLFIVATLADSDLRFTWPSPNHARLSAEPSQGSFDLGLSLLPAVTLWEAISDLPPMTTPGEVADYVSPPANPYQAHMREGAISPIHNHEPMKHTARLVQRFAQIGWGESEASVGTDHLPRRRGDPKSAGASYAQNSRRQRPDAPCSTVVASSHTNFLHPYLDRNFTVRELARVQSFPDRFVFRGKRAVLSHSLSARKGLVSDLHLDQRSQVGNAVPPMLGQCLGEAIVRMVDSPESALTHVA